MMYILSITDIWGFGYILLLLYCSYTTGTLDAVLITEIHVIYRFTADNVHELVSTALHIYVQIHTVQMKYQKLLVPRFTVYPAVVLCTTVIYSV